MLQLLFALPLLQSSSFVAPPRQSAADPVQDRAPNIVLIIADDLGVDLMPAYGAGDDLPCTPALDRLAASGMLFRNAWASPTCSPARAWA